MPRGIQISEAYMRIVVSAGAAEEILGALGNSGGRGGTVPQHYRESGEPGSAL